MRNPFNKAITETMNKTTGKAPRKDSTMNETFQAVLDAATAIDTSAPKIRAEYVQKMAEAQEAQRAANEAKASAETEKAFNKACDDESRARDKEEFYRRMISKIDYTARMDESEYFGHVHAVEDEVNAAAEEFRKAAEKAMLEIVAARSKYEATAAEADKVLIALDAAAYVLQVKYRYKEWQLIGKPSAYIEDPSEWINHAVRYRGNGRAFNLAVCDKNQNAPDTYNPVLTAAWHAAERLQSSGEKRRIAL